MASTFVSPFAILSKPIEEIRQYLAEYGAELKPTKFATTYFKAEFGKELEEVTCEPTYLIKFDPKTQAYHPAVNQLRGIIFRQTETCPVIYALGYPVPTEFKDQTPELQATILESLKSTTYTVQEALDGTLIRLWYHDESQKWMIATNSKEDAHEAFWMNGVSFGDLFESTLQGILTNLNTGHVYLFSLCHPLNVIVVNHTTPVIYHLTTIDRITLTEVNVDLGLKRPPTFEMTVDEVLLKVKESQSTPVCSAGYTIVPIANDDGIVYRHRFENLNYTRARALRGESNNIETIILQHLLRTTDTEPEKQLDALAPPAKLAEFLQYYPIYQQTFWTVSKRLNNLVTYIFQVYVQRYKFRKEIWTDPRHHRFLQEMHRELYLTHLRPQGLSVTLQDVSNYVYNQSPIKVSYLIEIL